MSENQSTATLFEYQKYPYESSKTDSFKEGTLHLTDKTIELLDSLNSKRPILEIGRNTIKPLNYVGVVRVNGFTVQILPKLFAQESCPEQKTLAAANLLKMLFHTENVPITEVDPAGLDLRKMDLFEVFIHLFAKNLLNTIKISLKREYITNSDELRVVRGRIDFQHHINPARMHIIPCRYHELSVDNLLNRTLRYTCYLMSRTVSDFTTIRLLRSIVNLLDPVTLTPVSVAEIDRITFSRLNRIFEPYIRMCRIFLSRSSLTLQASKVEFFSLLIPMERLFEEFVSTVLAEDPTYFFGRYVPVRSQAIVGRLVKDANGTELFNMKPDIVIGYPQIEAVIDTKYKQLDSGDRKLGVSQADLYQMYAYAAKTNARRCMLLYPEVLFEQKQDFALTVRSVEGTDMDILLMIRAVRLSHDLNHQDGWEAFRSELREIVRPLIAEREPLTTTESGRAAAEG
ncbi:McrC family protein [Methanoculleus horonobensis]|jgi:5-methylcytosine-specific restriction enzyme subunit McrC|uniref:McrC family protein n=1 Tax=Methanoculleus horonobensis TaxID=528314 RepID=UPI00083564A3|nr:McrC family protein [Methanoculleus horonobensis]